MTTTVQVNVSFIPKQYISWYIEFIILYAGGKVTAHGETLCLF